MDLASNAIQEVNFPSQFVEKFFWEEENPSYIALEVRTLSKELQTILDNESFEQLRKDVESSNNVRHKALKSSVKYIRPCKDIRRPWKSSTLNKDEEEDDLQKKLSRKYVSGQGGGSDDDENYRRTTDIELPRGVQHAIITIFADSEKGILIHEKRVDLDGKFLVGLGVPCIYLAENGATASRIAELRDLKDGEISKSVGSLINYASTYLLA